MAIGMVVEDIELEGGAEELLDQPVAVGARPADQRMAEGQRQLNFHQRRRSLVGLEIDGLGIDQQAIHVENDGLDGFIEHGFVLSLPPETANIGGRKIHAHP